MTIIKLLIKGKRGNVSSIKFESEEVRQRFTEVFLFCYENKINLSVECIGLHPPLVRKEDFDLNVYLETEELDEDTVIDDDTEIRIGLPRAENEDVSLGYFYQAMQDALQGRIEDDTLFISPKRVFVHVDCNQVLLEKISHEELSLRQAWGDNTIGVSIVQGLTSYGIRLSLDGYYDKYYPPMVSEDTFIEIQALGNMNRQTIEEIIEAYIFELQCIFSTLGIQRSIRPTMIYDPYEDVEDDQEHTLRMRPLIKGKGMFTLLQIYNSSNQVEDDEYRILNYTKIIEYVSQTVVRKEMLDSILIKLYSPRVLQPDATYILELEELYDEHRKNQRDHQAIKLTVETCCDLTDLIDIAPSFLKKFSETRQKEVNKQAKAACFEELAGSISDTRNMIAHAKTNYKMKGKECPSDQLSAFADCLKVVAIQIIRWFARQHEDSRII